jgi:RimJ/RimL family protein N-acetyltransferase
MILENDHVRLEPLTLEHVDALVEAAKDRSTFQLAPVPRDRAEMIDYIEKANADSKCVPFVTIMNGEVVGSIRLMNMEFWIWPPGPILIPNEPRSEFPGPKPSAGPDFLWSPNAAEIGHAWLAPKAQRTAVNTAQCLLLMTHAFDLWKVHRLVLKTDARNQRSRNAILRLGAKFEGILRAHLPAADGIVRDTAMFSVVPSEWPEIRKRLESALASSHNH